MTDEKLLAVDQALATVLEQVVALGVEQVPLARAVGRFLADDVLAGLDLPPFTNSAMDGFALRAADTPGVLRVIGESAAGRPFAGSVGAGEAITISTGAAIPDGADTVVMIERVERVSTSPSGMTVRVPDTTSVGDCFREVGSDVRSGALVLKTGTLVRPAQIGAAAALGLTQLPCARLPRVAVIPTGDELRGPGEPLGPGQIYNSNGPMLSALLEDAGALVTEIAAVTDDLDSHRSALTQALEHDLVITSGGVSVGPHDLVRGIARELGVRELFWRVKLRPGKPLSFGVRGPTLVFGLPGNPVSTLVCFELFVRPALMALQGSTEPRPRFQSGVLARDLERHSQREELIRVWRDAAGRLDPLPGQQSHQITITAQADGLVRVPSGSGGLLAGSEVAYLPLRER